MKIFIADFETTPFNFSAENDYFLHSRFVCFKNITKNKKYFFNIEKNGKETIKKFILDNCSLNNPTRIYFHNLRFDLAFLYSLLPNGYNFQVIRNNSTIISFRIFKEYKRLNKKGKVRIERKTLLELRDSLVILKSSIEKIGNSLGFPKLNIDYNMIEITQEYIDYCFRDIEVIEKAFNKICNLYQEHFNYPLRIENFPLTLPSLSKRTFHKLIIRKYGKSVLNRIYDINSEKYETKIREYYYGGRVEVFNFNVCLNGYYNDFNSFYPTIMKENEFPLTPYSFYKCNHNDSCFTKWKTNKNVFACICEISENLNIPLIASKINGKLVFGIGKKKCLLFRKEIEYLLSLKQKVKILEIIMCSGYLDLFSDFVDICYSIKQSYKDNSFEYWFAKIKMNSLYGKLAEKREKEKIEIVHSIKGISEKEIRDLSITDNGFVKRKTEIYHTIKINVFYSMMITSLCRLRLHKSIMESKKPYYTDSDSIVSNDLIENSKELGHLKPEFTFRKFQALGCKEYIIEKTEVKVNPIIKVPLKSISIKMKGFGRLQHDNFELFISQYFNPKKQNRMVGFMEAFNRELPLNLVLVYDKFKRSVYDKRWIKSDLSTKPFHLQNDDFEKMIENNKYYIKKIINGYKNTYEN